jgi:hypothetical protein
MGKKMITLKIKDISWKFILLQNSKYDKMFGQNSGAITVHDDKTVYFKLMYLEPKIVHHELAHVYFASCCTISSIESINAETIEETFAEIWENHFSDVIKNATLIYEDLLKQKDKLLKTKGATRGRKNSTK